MYVMSAGVLLGFVGAIIASIYEHRCGKTINFRKVCMSISTGIMAGVSIGLVVGAGISSIIPKKEVVIKTSQLVTVPFTVRPDGSHPLILTQGTKKTVLVRQDNGGFTPVTFTTDEKVVFVETPELTDTGEWTTIGYGADESSMLFPWSISNPPKVTKEIFRLPVGSYGWQQLRQEICK